MNHTTIESETKPKSSANIAFAGSLAMLFAMLAVFSGCETDYEPLRLKKKMRELEKRIEKLEGTNEVTEPESNTESAAMSETERAALVTKIEDAGGYIVTADDATVTEVDLTEIQNGTNELLEELAPFTRLKRVSLNGPRLDSKSFEILSELSSVERLDIENSAPTEEDLQQLREMPNLKFLQLFRASISNDSLKTIATFPKLEQLRCGQTRITSEGVAALQDLETLRALDLTDNQISDTAIEELASLPNLMFLKIWGGQISDKSLEAIAKMPKLKVLGLNYTKVTDAGIRQLTGLKNLQEIYLFGTDVGDDGMRALAEIPTLKTLVLRNTRISDDGVAALSSLPNLAKLDLSETNSPGVTNESAPHFAKMEKLQDVNLWSTQIGNPVVAEIAELESVTRLNLDKTSINDEALKMLEKMPQLKWLHVGSNYERITDEGAESLLELENLKYLNVSQTQISEDMFYELDDMIAPSGGTVIGP